VPDSVPPVLADPVMLDQVITNLLDNAIRYGCGSMIALVARELEGTVELRVIDHGPGIPEPERERVFDQFYRLKGGGKRPEGTGMGLSISRGIVAALHGHLRVETTPGGGATFVLTLPVAKSAAEGPVPAASPEGDGQVAASGASGASGGKAPGPAGDSGASGAWGGKAPGPAGDSGASGASAGREPAERKARR
jgi:two-component system sensor histidine kinase KdpD